MNKVAVVFWSGTGNTEKMAQCIAAGANEAGGTAQLLSPTDFSASVLSDFDAVAFGCPSMGVEVLEETEFEPMFASLENSLNGKKTALFGSYGWGDGEWMRQWCARCDDDGANLFDDKGLIVNEAPDADGEEKCKNLGKELAVW